MFTAAIFDMDGLLLDSERVIMQAWMESAQELALSLSRADFLQVVGHGIVESHARLSTLLGGPGSFQLVRDRARAKLAAAADVVFPLKPGALALLQQLRARGVPCAVASSTFVHEVRRRLAQVGVLELLQAIAGGDDALAKPTDGDRSSVGEGVPIVADERLAPHGAHQVDNSGQDLELGALTRQHDRGGRERAHCSAEASGVRRRRQ